MTLSGVATADNVMNSLTGSARAGRRAAWHHLGMRFCLLPSPLTVPAVAEPLAERLRSRGHEAVGAPGGATDVAEVLAGFVAAARDADVVVPHSNAGRFGPAVADAVGATLVCLDALLPGPEPHPDWVEVLRSHEQPDGLLAPWSTWWPRADLEAVVGDHGDLLTTDEPRVPLRLLVEQPPAPPGWLGRRSGYVAFGPAYADQAATTEAHGWEVRRLDGEHLHLLTAPDEVADAILDVLDGLRDTHVTELVGVYDADGGLLGEAAYLWGRIRGSRHCSLCDITHSPWRRKPAWDAMVAELGLPVRLLHLNELDAELAGVVGRVGAPVVLGRAGDRWSVVASGEELDAMGGSVDRLGALLRERWGQGAGADPT